MELLVKPEMLTSYIYGPTFGNAETVSFYLLHNVSTLNQCREVSCVTQMWHRKPLCIDSVLKHCAANRKRLFQRCQTWVHMYTTLAFLALLGAQYIYEISSLRVNVCLNNKSRLFCASLSLFFSTVAASSCIWTVSHSAHFCRVYIGRQWTIATFPQPIDS